MISGAVVKLNSEDRNVVPITPDSKIRHFDVGNRHIDFLLAPKKLSLRTTENGEFGYSSSALSFYNSQGISQETVKSVAKNLGLAFEEVASKSEDKENCNDGYIVEEID